MLMVMMMMMIMIMIMIMIITIIILLIIMILLIILVLITITTVIIVVVIVIIIEDACGESPPHRRAHEQKNPPERGWNAGGPARAAARPLSFAEALLNEVEPGFNTPMRRWRGGFMGYRRCRRPIAGWYDWGARETWEIAPAHRMILIWHEVGMK